MRRILFVHTMILLSLIFSLLIFSCATTTKTVEPTKVSTTEKKETKSESTNPLAPQILEMGFTSSFGKDSQSVQKIKSGKQAVLYMRLRDSEWNLAGVTITAQNGNKKAEPISINFDYQYQEEFVFAQSLDVPEEKGSWTFTAVAFDHGGHRSSAVKTTVTVE